MKRIITAVGVAVTVSLALAACGGGQVKNPDSASDTFVIAPTLEVVTDLDPSISYSNESIALQNVYESLTRYNSETQSAEPLLATDWAVSEDALTWTFTLRDDVVFHSGRAMDAESVVESLERNRAADAGAAYIWGAVSNIEATNATTVTFTLDYPAPLDLIASSNYSAYVFDVDAAGGDDANEWFNSGNDAGTGPYTISEWKKGAEVEMRLTAFEKYWGGWESNQFKNVEFRVTPDANTAWQLLQSGEVDYVPFLTPQLFAQAEKTSSVQAVSGTTFQNLMALFNTAAGPASDVNVRKALQLAIDYEGMVATLDGAGQTASGIVTEGLLGYTPGIEGKTDLAEAAALLEKAGYGPGAKKLELTMTYAQGDDAQAKFATLLVSAIQQLGGSLTATPMEWNAQWDLAKSADASQRQDIFMMYWWPDYPDAFSWFINVFHSEAEISFGLSYFSDPELDAAIEMLPGLTATDPDAASAAYAALQKTILTDNALGAIAYVQTAQRVLSDRVVGFIDDPAYANVVRVYDTTIAP